MDKFNIEQIRIIAVSMITTVLGYISPTNGYVISLIIMFALNIFAGMRADGVSVVRCKNFSVRKFKNSLVEFLLYLLIIETIFTVMHSCGDGDAALIAVKSVTYVFVYVYAQNALKNLIYAYPDIIALRILYHAVRFEFKRALPSYIKPIVERIEAERKRRAESEKSE